MRMIDLRSDTVTGPTGAMRRAMARAVVGDDVFGEDPTVRRLEALAAKMTGKPAALFVPTGTMGNQIALHVWCRPGQEVIADRRSHLFNYETGAFAALSGIVPRALEGDRGILRAGQIEVCLRPRPYYMPPVGLISVESTHNMAGGTVYPLAVLREIRAIARAHRLPVHLDGARIFNAAVARGVPAREIARHADSVMFCLSKGLCAPVGSMLCGPKDFIGKARRVRKMFGGGMRQAGVLAAAGLIALRMMTRRLAEDHRHARRIAGALAARPDCRIDPETVQTNIVIFEMRDNGASGFCDRLRRAGILALPIGDAQVRMVTHHDVRPAAVRRVCRVLGTI